MKDKCIILTESQINKLMLNEELNYMFSDDNDVDLNLYYDNNHPEYKLDINELKILVKKYKKKKDLKYAVQYFEKLIPIMVIYLYRHYKMYEEEIGEEPMDIIMGFWNYKFIKMFNDTDLDKHDGCGARYILKGFEHYFIDKIRKIRLRLGIRNRDEESQVLGTTNQLLGRRVDMQRGDIEYSNMERDAESASYIQHALEGDEILDLNFIDKVVYWLYITDNEIIYKLVIKKMNEVNESKLMNMYTKYGPLENERNSMFIPYSRKTILLLKRIILRLLQSEFLQKDVLAEKERMSKDISDKKKNDEEISYLQSRTLVNNALYKDYVNQSGKYTVKNKDDIMFVLRCFEDVIDLYALNNEYIEINDKIATANPDHSVRRVNGRYVSLFANIEDVLRRKNKNKNKNKKAV